MRTGRTGDQVWLTFKRYHLFDKETRHEAARPSRDILRGRPLGHPRAGLRPPGVRGAVGLVTAPGPTTPCWSSRAGCSRGPSPSRTVSLHTPGDGVAQQRQEGVGLPRAAKRKRRGVRGIDGPGRSDRGVVAVAKREVGDTAFAHICACSRARGFSGGRQRRVRGIQGARMVV